MPELMVIRNIEDVIAHNNWTYINHTSRCLTEPGENYGSVLLAIEMDYEEDGKRYRAHLVAKMCPPNEILKKAFITDVTFKKEMQFYKDAVPSLDELQNEHNIVGDKRLNVFAKCFGARVSIDNDFVDDDAVIILENLKLKSYIVENRMVGFDDVMSHMILKKLARWHGTTIAMKLRKPKIYEEFVMPCLEPINPGSTMMNGFCEVALHFASQIEECTPYIKKLIDAVEFGKKTGGLKFPVQTNDNFCTMVHVDLWTNNIMVTKDKTRIKFVDFQLLDYGSVARDLLFFLFSSVNLENLEEQLDNYIRFYYDCFVECLTDFKCETAQFSWEAFMAEVETVARYEFFHMIFMLKPIFSEKGSVGDINKISQDDFAKIDNIGDAYKRRLRYTVVTFGEKLWI